MLVNKECYEGIKQGEWIESDRGVYTGAHDILEKAVIVDSLSDGSTSWYSDPCVIPSS